MNALVALNALAISVNRRDPDLPTAGGPYRSSPQDRQAPRPRSSVQAEMPKHHVGLVGAPLVTSD